MAKPIKITPVLKGREAINFYSKLEENRVRRVEKGHLSEIRENAKQLKSIFKFK